MIVIRKDYNGFAGRNELFLNELFNGEGFNVDLKPYIPNEKTRHNKNESNTPFFCNLITINGVNDVYYNNEIITKCKLNEREQDACILHEIGHIIAAKLYALSDSALEEYCDSVAVLRGYRLDMLSALIKMRESLNLLDEEMNGRIYKLGTFYRPVWTCGRYDAKKQAAIYYNLIAGMSFFFESYSAMVIGEVLSVPRNGIVNIEDISIKLNISMESLMPFFQQLEQLGIISSVFPSSDVISDYRKRTFENNCMQTQTVEKSTQEKLPYEISNAEQEYTKKVGGITSVMFEVTYNCSEKCIHCYNIGATRNDKEQSMRGNRDELTLAEYKCLIDDLYEQGLIKVCLTGGDPFSKPFTWEIIDYLYHKNIAFDIFTNGQGIVSETERLANYFPRLVGVSIYSGITEVHDLITRIKGSWKRSMSVVSQLSAFAVPMHLKCCVMRPNVKSYYMVYDIARQFGIMPQFEICLTDSIEGDRCASKYLRMTNKQMEIVLRDDNIPLYVGEEAPNYGGQKKIKSLSPCLAGENSLCITPEGNVIPCCSFHTLFGNIREQNIKDIINKSIERKYWLNLSLKDYEECGNHNYCDYCNLCPGNNYVEHGTPLKASEVNCHIAKSRYELALKMQQGYDPLQGKPLREKLDELPDYVSVELKREMSQNYNDTRLQVGG